MNWRQFAHRKRAKPLGLIVANFGGRRKVARRTGGERTLVRRTRGEGSDFLVVLSLHVCLFRVCLGFLPRGVMIEGGLEIFAPNIFYRFKSNLINNYLSELEIGFAKQRKQQDRAVQCYRYQGGMENFAQFFFYMHAKVVQPRF